VSLSPGDKLLPLSLTPVIKLFPDFYRFQDTGDYLIAGKKDKTYQPTPQSEHLVKKSLYECKQQPKKLRYSKYFSFIAVSLTLVTTLYFRISPRFVVKIRNSSNGILGGPVENHS
jgi:hypothetical protein